MEKQFPRMGLLIADDLQARVVKSSRGGADGENGKRADKPKYIQKTTAAQSHQKLAEPAFVRKKPHA
jgi:hypothetical protein